MVVKAMLALVEMMEMMVAKTVVMVHRLAKFTIIYIGIK